MIKPYEETLKLLKVNNITYKEIHHEPAYTSEQAAKVRGVSTSRVTKSLLLKYGSHFILAVLPGDHKLSYKKVKNLLKIKKLRFATPEEVENKMGCEIGACYPLGNLIGLPVYVDNASSQNDTLFFNPGLPNLTIEIKWQDFCSMAKPKFGDISEKSNKF